MDLSQDGLSSESMFSVCPIVLEGLALCLLVTVREGAGGSPLNSTVHLT